jgi:hypothetical protein
MPKSKNRKAHKAKSAARTQSLMQRRQYAMSLVKELEEQLQLIKDNPTTGVDIQPQEMVMLTPSGPLPSYEIKL